MNNNINILNNPPTFLNAEEFANLGSGGNDMPTNPETLDIFTDLNWIDLSSSNNNNGNNINNINTLPLPTSPTPPIVPHIHNIVEPVEPVANTQSIFNSPILSSNSLKKDIIKYLYKSGSCAYLNSCFSKLEDIDTANDNVLYKKFKIGLVIDSVMGKNSSDKNLANYVFTFFEVLLSEAKKFTPTDIQKYIDVFTMSLQKDKITILNDSGSAIIAKILASRDIDEFLETIQDNDTPSMKALKSSLQNVSLLISLTLTKRLFSPYFATFFNKYEDNGHQPLNKKQKVI